MGIETIAAIATIASAAFGVASATGILGGKSKGAAPPPVQAPAQGATTSRNDTASQVVMGADNVRNQRVGAGSSTNGGTQAQTTNTADILGGLGAGGINI